METTTRILKGLFELGFITGLAVALVVIVRRLVTWIITRDNKRTIYVRNPATGKKVTVVLEPNLKEGEFRSALRELESRTKPRGA